MSSPTALRRKGVTVGYSLNGYEFDLISEFSLVNSHVGQVFAEFPSLARGSGVRDQYSVSEGRNGFELALNGRLLAAFRDIGDSIDFLEWYVSQVSLRRVSDTFALHAAGVAHDGRALIIAGTSGAGKSTLTVELLRSGFGYLSDEAIFVSISTGRVCGFPRAIALASDPRARQSPIPPIDETTILGDQTSQGNDGEARPTVRKNYFHAAEFGATVVPSPLPVAAVVVLDTVRADTRLAPVGPLDLLPDLVGQVFAAGPADIILETLTGMLAGANTFRLTTSDPRQAARILSQRIACAEAA